MRASSFTCKSLVCMALLFQATTASAQTVKLPKSPIELTQITDDGKFVTVYSSDNKEIKRHQATRDLKLVDTYRVNTDGKIEKSKIASGQSKPAVLVRHKNVVPYLKKILRPNAFILMEKNGLDQSSDSLEDAAVTPISSKTSPGMAPGSADVRFAMIGPADTVVSFQVNNLAVKTGQRDGRQTQVQFLHSEMHQNNASAMQCYKLGSDGQFAASEHPKTYGPAVFLKDATDKASLKFLGKLLRPGSIIFSKKSPAGGPR